MTPQAIDAELQTRWQQFAGESASGQPEAALQRRFATSALFPLPVWHWLAAGEALAVERQDVEQLHGILQRVQACAHACWGRPDADGLHHGGEDHCAAVIPALHALALGSGYAAAQFHEGRRLSTRGHAARRHAANLLVALHHPGWPLRAKALAAAQAAVDGRAGSAADRAFVGTLLALAANDSAGLQRHLPDFAAAYTRSDWGRHDPGRQPVVVAHLLALARRHHPLPSVAALEETLLSPARLRLWRAHGQAVAAGCLPPLRLDPGIAFLVEGLPDGSG